MDTNVGVKFEDLLLSENGNSGIEPRWGQRIYTEKKFTKASLESALGSKLNTILANTPSMIKYVITTIADLCATYGAASFIVAALDSERERLIMYLDKINRGQCTYIVDRTYWVPGPIYGYYVYDSNVLTYI